MCKGPNALASIGKKFKNPFWKHVFLSVIPLMQGAVLSDPEKIFIAPLWDNKLILRNGNPLRKTQYPLISSTINTISDFFHPNTSVLKTRDELEMSHNCILDMDTFQELLQTIKTSLRSLGLPDFYATVTNYPYQPLLIRIIRSSRKGCRTYYQLMRKKVSLNNNLTTREAKWHTELNTTYSETFWTKTYQLTSGIRCENRIKWLQFQINRNSLYTNYRVNKFNAQVSPFCTFCQQDPSNVPSLEKIAHLMYDCHLVQNLWTEVGDWFGSLAIDLPLSRTNVLFGIQNQLISSVPNSVILYVKYYIWITKQKQYSLSIVALKNFFRTKLNDLKNVYLYQDRVVMFDQWINVYENLSDD